MLIPWARGTKVHKRYNHRGTTPEKLHSLGVRMRILPQQPTGCNGRYRSAPGHAVQLPLRRLQRPRRSDEQ